MSRAQILIISALSTIMAAAIIVLFVMTRPPTVGTGGVSGAVQSTGAALVGGPFTLNDHTGKRVTEADYRGKFMLVFFGYTYCPDICPAELQVVAAALDELGDKAKDVQPIFITVDPERDTVKQMGEYVENFHPSQVGLTGSAEEIAKVAKAYRVYYARVEDEAANDYLMDHSSILYLMDREGRFVTHFNYGTDAKALAKGLAERLG